LRSGSSAYGDARKKDGEGEKLKTNSRAMLASVLLGSPFLAIGPRTQTVSEPLLNNIRNTGGSVLQNDPGTRQFTPVDIGRSGSWKRN